MKLQYLQPLIGFAAQALASDDFVIRRRGTEFNISPRHDHVVRDGSSGPDNVLETRQDAVCGSGKGSCPLGQCCSESGKCGTAKDYCTGPQCQIQFSNGRCDANEKPSGSSTLNVPRNNGGNVAYDKYIIACTEPGTVALTFDDGPYKYTDHVLDLLDEHDIKATFFIAGNNLGKKPIDDENTPWPGILRRMHKAGHQLASHTWTHQDLSAASQELREQQIIYNEMAFRNIFGWFPKYMRPPYGTCSRDSGCLDYVTKLGYHVINFNIDTKDFQNNTPEKIQTSKNTFNNGLADVNKGYIELSHDIQQQTVYNLTEYMIKTLQDKGYRGVTVAECLGDSKENWYVDASSTVGNGNVGTGIPDPSQDGSDPSKATTSTDGTCGWRSGGKYSCKGSKYGDCCSYNGWCGKSSGHCDGGCLSDFGKCNKATKGEPPIMSENGLCGEKPWQGCLGSKYGNCCSKYGFCGRADSYCGNGCQSSFGLCS